MPRFFVHYWSNPIIEDALDNKEEGTLLDCTAGEGLVDSGVSVGDMVYIVNVYRGELYVIARMQVGEIILGRNAAWKKLRNRAWAADEHLVAARGSGTPLYFSRVVPAEHLPHIRFVDGRQPERLSFLEYGRIDKKSIRGFREIDAGTARLFEELISMPFIPPDDNANESDDMFDEEEDEATLDEHDVDDIRRQYDNAEIVERTADVARSLAIRELEGRGYRYDGPLEDEDGAYDLRFYDGEERIPVIVKGTVDIEPAFFLSDRELTLLEEDPSAVLCVVTGALSRSPRITVLTAEEFFDDFAMRPVLYAVKKVD
ncbi:MAG: hypothetical protein QHI48_03805 [Bacteroidota bacterium]|nr:hypothetical protein [Bacteroidota bacterium]